MERRKRGVTQGLVLLAAWAQLAVLVAILIVFLRRSGGE